jgi:hypothetical protein
MTLVGATGIAGSTEQTAPRYPGEWPQTGIISGQQTTLSMGQNRFAFASLAAADFWGGNDVVFPGGGVDGRPMFRSGGLPVYWTDSFFGYSGGGWRPVVQFNFRTSSGLFDNCTVRADEDAQYQSSFGIGPNQLGYAQFIYSAGTHFIGTRYGIGTGHDSIFSGNRFDTDIGIKVDALSSSNWGFGGLTVGENEYTGQEHVITGPSYYEPLPETIDDIVPADLTLEELFQNIDEWRSQWGATSDPNEQRKQELLQLIAELEAQLAAAREELENL